MLENLKLTVIIPAYNAVNTLSDAVDSVVAASGDSYEILLINDGSTDTTLELCNELAGKYPSVRVFDKENGGVSSARNLGIENIRGEYVAFCDADDTVAPDMYVRLMSVCEAANADVGVCGRRLMTAQPVDKVARGGERFVEREEAIRLFLCDDGFDISMCNKIYRSRLFDGVRFDTATRIAEEINVLLSVFEKGNGAAICNDVLYFVRMNEHSATRSGFSDKFLEALSATGKALARCETEHPHAYNAALAMDTGFTVDVIRRALRGGDKLTAKKLRAGLMADYGRRYSNPDLRSNTKKKLKLLRCGLNVFGIAMKLYYR